MTDVVSDPAVDLDRDHARWVLRTMCRIRAFEERVGSLKRADEVYGLIHLSTGQEAVAAAVASRIATELRIRRTPLPRARRFGAMTPGAAR